MLTVVAEIQTMLASEAAWALEYEDIVGYGYFEVDTGCAGRRGLPFEDGSDAFANGSVRPALFPGTKQPSACRQLEGRLGTENDSGHLSGPFIFPWDPSGPPQTPMVPSTLGGLAFWASSRISGGFKGST